MRCNKKCIAFFLFGLREMSDTFLIYRAKYFKHVAISLIKVVRHRTSGSAPNLRIDAP